MRSPPLIVIADDSPPSLDILRTRLLSQGYEVIAATDGQEALDAVAGRHPSRPVLLDVMMPKLDGFEAPAVAGRRSLPFIPIILVTARPTVRATWPGWIAGADEYLTKPVDQPR